MKEFFEKYKYKLLTVLAVCLVFTGFNYIFEGFFKDNQNPEHYPIFLLCITVIGFYVVPLYFGIKYLIKRFNVSINMIGLSMILGFTACAYLGGEGNTLLSMFWLTIDPARHFINDWGAALTAPFAEELAKGFVVLLVFWLCKKMSLKAAFVCSLIVGLGFQVPEDMLYIYNSIFFNNVSGFVTAFERVAPALGTHMIFTGMFGVGCIALIKNSTAISKTRAIFYMFSAIGLHFMWNSPFEWQWLTPVLGSIGLYIVYDLFTIVDKLDDNDQIIENKPIPNESY